MINTYHNFCWKVANRVTIFDTPSQQRKPSRAETDEPKYVHLFDIHFSPFKYPILDAPQVCKEIGGRQPEICDKQSMEAIRFAAITKGVKKISAGINYDSNNNVFRYISDDVNARYQSLFLFLEYGGYYIGQAYRASNWEDKYACNPTRTSTWLSTTILKRSSLSGSVMPMTKSTRTTSCARYPGQQ